MRIRTIKPEFFLHDSLFDAESESKLPLRVAYIGLWCAADREGRFRWEPRRLGAAILPYDCIDFSRVLDALSTRGFIERHASEGVDFGVIPSFKRHQIINNRETPSNLPEPSEESMIIGAPTRGPRDADACGTRGQRPKAEGKGREGKGREQEGNGNGRVDDALSIYEAYPKKVERPEALKEISAALKIIPHADLLEAVQAYAAAVAKWPEEEKAFIPSCGRWMKKQRWFDDRSTWKKTTKQSKNGVKHDGFATTDYLAGLDGLPTF